MFENQGTAGSGCAPAVSNRKAQWGSPDEEQHLEATQLALGLGCLEWQVF